MNQKKSKTILIVGPVLSSIEHIDNNAASSATTEFLQNFIDLLNYNGSRVLLLNFMPARLFPFGSLFPISNCAISDQYKAIYINFPFLSGFTKFLAIGLQAINVIINHKVEKIILYNWHNYYIAIFILCKIFSIDLRVYAADYPVNKIIKKVIDINYSRHLINVSSGVDSIFYPGARSINSNKDNLTFKEKGNSIAYAGNYGESSKIHELIEFFLRGPQNVPLYLYGKVPKKIIEQCAFCNKVIVVGYLLEPEFSKSLMRHRLLIDFRNKDHPLYSRSFPSKLLFYHQFNSLIVTNAVEALGDHLSNGFYIIDDDLKFLKELININSAVQEKMYLDNKISFNLFHKILTQNFIDSL